MWRRTAPGTLSLSQKDGFLLRGTQRGLSTDTEFLIRITFYVHSYYLETGTCSSEEKDIYESEKPNF